MQEILKIESLKKNMYNIYIFVHPPLTLLLSMIVNKEKNEIPTKKAVYFCPPYPDSEYIIYMVMASFV